MLVKMSVSGRVQTELFGQIEKSMKYRLDYEKHPKKGQLLRRNIINPQCYAF